MTEANQLALEQLVAAAGNGDAVAFRAAVGALRAAGANALKWQSAESVTIGGLIAKAMTGEADEIAVWHDCMKVFEFRAEDWKLLAKVYAEDDLYPDALRALEQISGDRELRATYLLRSGRICKRMADWPRALFFFETGVREFGKAETSPGFLLERANVHLQLRMFEEAAADFIVIKARWPKHPAGYEGLVSAFCENRAFAAAQCIADEAARHIRNSGKVRGIQAIIVGDHGSQSEVETFLASLASESIEDEVKSTIVDRVLKHSTNYRTQLWEALKRPYVDQPLCLRAISRHQQKAHDLVATKKTADSSGRAESEHLGIRARCSAVGKLVQDGLVDEAVELATSVEHDTAKWPSRPQDVLNVVLWRMVRTGRVDEAKSLYWRQRILRRKPDRRCELALLKQGGGDPAVTVFVQARNEFVNLPSFLDHHRKLGVKEFCVVDNGSTDESVSFLQRCDDVTVYQTASSYRRAAAGADWFNALTREPRYRDSLCLRLDADERFVYPHCDRAPVTALRTYLRQNRFDAIAGMMVDMFPRSYAEIQATGDHVTPSRYFEPDIDLRQSLFAPYVEYYAPPRLRSTSGLRPQVAKVPGTMSGSLIERIGSHRCSPAAVADVSCALIHYKFRPNFAARAQEEILRREYAQNGQYWTQFPDFEGGAAIMTSATSREYTSWRSLMEAGLLKSSQSWDRNVASL